MTPENKPFSANAPAPPPKRRRRRALIIAAVLLAAALVAAGAWAALRPKPPENTAPSQQTQETPPKPSDKTANPAPDEITGPTEEPTDTATEPPDTDPAPAEPVRYPYVLVHGMAGWGESSPLNRSSHYWGGDTGDLAAYLRGEGYEVYVPTVGPLSSAWDRACELYAALTGTRVDYGAAHAAAHNHERFGRTYPAMQLQWDETHKLNLVGHSFGGETVRLLVSLLAYGDEAELADGAEDISPLFTGGKAAYVHSVTTLASPHNGSSLTCAMEEWGGVFGFTDLPGTLANFCYTLADTAADGTRNYDFMLDQFGIDGKGLTQEQAVRAVSDTFAKNSDYVGFDLSPDGARLLNEKIRMPENVYYFSYAWQITGDSADGQVQNDTTLSMLTPFMFVLGIYTGTTKGGITIDESWLPNDGLVNTVSAEYPADAPHAAWEPGETPRQGLWNVAPVRSGHHGTAIGLGADADAAHAFYTDLFAVIDRLP